MAHRLSLPRSLLIAAGVRSFATGLTGVLLGLHLAQLGLGAAALGMVIGSGLAGLAAGTTLVAFVGDRIGRGRTLVGTTVLSCLGLVGVALAGTPPALAVAALLGMVNGMGRDRGPAQALEQSLLADSATDATRTAAFTRYTLIQDLAGAAGALAAVVPTVVEHTAGLSAVTATRVTLVAVAALILTSLPCYLALPRDPRPVTSRPWWHVPLSRQGRRHVRGLAALFALDSLGGGFLAGSILTFWFFRRFGLSGDVLGPIFFAARLMNAASYVGAAWLAARIGLVRTMVFTHLPSSALLCALPFVPSSALAVLLFLVRESLVQMDVPTRQSYLAAVTRAGERTFAMGVTGVVRNVGWAFGPPLGGLAMSVVGLGAPLLIGAGLKIVYDVALFASFRNVPAPEEAPPGPGHRST